MDSTGPWPRLTKTREEEIRSNFWKLSSTADCIDVVVDLLDELDALRLEATIRNRKDIDNSSSIE